MGQAPSEPGIQPGTWHIGAAELHEAEGRLVADGRSRVLDRSGHEILRYLLEHAGEVVTKEELLDAGWPGRVVAENSLAKAIGRLRGALGGAGEAIRAVHGYGYRLTGTVRFVPARSAGPGGIQPGPAVGDRLPGEAGWILLDELGAGGSGTTFLAQSATQGQRVVKIANDPAGLRSLKREIALSRYIRSVMPDLDRTMPILGWNLERTPCFIELPYFPAGNLQKWSSARGGLATVPPGHRLALFASLCEAVAGLHEIGIIHKDLKPENLYPQQDSAGEWRIVVSDLGAGEAIGSPQLGELSLTLSTTIAQVPQQAGSLLYLAPEIIAGDPPTQRSDVFSLGVLLYQLSVGDLRLPLAPGWEDDVDDPLLRADIALAAAARPERRMVDARTLFERVRTLPARRVAHEQALTRARLHEEQGRQLLRLRQRRRWLQAGIGVLGFVLILSLWQQHRVEKARDAMEIAAHAARENAGIADAVNRFFNQDVLAAASPYASNGAQEPTLLEAIERATARIDTRFRDQPLIEATVRMTIGQVYGEAMDIARSIEQTRRALALFERHAGSEDPRTQQARYRLATDLTDASQFDEARQLIDDTDALRHRLGQADPETTLLSRRASCYWHIWRQLYDAGQPACEGVIASQLLVDAGDRNALVKARTNLAVLHSRAGRFTEAEVQFTRVEEDFAALGDDASPTRIRTLYLHGMNLAALARYEDAERLLTRAHASSMDALGTDNPHTLEVQTGLAGLYLHQQRRVEAIVLLEHAYATYVSQLGPDNHHTRRVREMLDRAR